MLHDTIAAVSTPRGKGGIAVIRVSGEDTAKILSRCFQTSGPIPAEHPRRACFGRIVADGETVDTGLAVFYSKGNSFTGEASAELSCHGGVAVTSAVLEAVFRAGARPAQAGEFTRRAFLSGTLTLTQAEAVGQLIDADTDSRRKLASAAARGTLREQTEVIRGKLKHVLAALYAAIDYPDEEIGEDGEAELEGTCRQAIGELERLLSTYRTGRAVAQGVVTVICGAPNCGKSSLYNRLLGEERAIVTDIAGTTRDTLWDTVDFGGITLRLADTAGLRCDTADAVEKIGVERARQSLGAAELIIALFDGSRALSDEEQDFLTELEQRRDVLRIAVINKSDLGLSPSFNRAAVEACTDRAVEMSAKTGDGLEALSAAVEELYRTGELSLSDDPVIWDARHKATLEEVLSLLRSVADGLQLGEPTDALCTLAENALGQLSLLDGRGVSEEIVSEIFARFCVGK